MRRFPAFLSLARSLAVLRCLAAAVAMAVSVSAADGEAATPGAGASGGTMANHREAIDALDARLVELLNERAAHAAAIGAIKRAQGLGAYAPARERQVLERVRALNRGPLPDAALGAIWREIMSGSLALEGPPRVACLGPAATFTHQAALTRFGSGAEYRFQASMGEAVAEVAAGRATHAVVAYHNSTEGAVHPTLDALASMPEGIRVEAEVVLPVEHTLATRAGMLRGVRRLHVHPQTRAQCRRWIAENLPGVEILEASSNARAAELAAGDRWAAALCGVFTAEHYGVPVRVRGTQDAAGNATRFLVLGRGGTPPTGRDRTVLVVESGDGSAALERALERLRAQGIRVEGVQARPVPGTAGGQRFFLECAGHDQTEGFVSALDSMRRAGVTVRSLGGHPEP